MQQAKLENASREDFETASDTRLGIPPLAGDPDAPETNGEVQGAREKPTIFGSYRLLELLGEGAMGTVYRAEHLSLRRQVALKIMRPELRLSHECAQRFLAEARAANRVHSEHIVEVTDMCLDPSGYTYLVMELLDGEDLAQARANRRLNLLEALEVVRQLCQTMSEVHDANVVHRDLKPENVFLVRRDGKLFIKLLDFGVAKLSDREGEALTATRPGMLVGTPHYMAPEQASAVAVDFRADLYAIGVILFEVLTDRQPFTSPTLRGLLMDITVNTPPLVSVCADLPASIRREADDLVAACLRKDPAERPRSAGAIQRRVERMIDAFAREAPETREALPTTKPARPSLLLPERPSSIPTLSQLPARADIDPQPDAVPPLAATPTSQTTRSRRPLRRKLLIVAAVVGAVCWAAGWVTRETSDVSTAELGAKVLDAAAPAPTAAAVEDPRDKPVEAPPASTLDEASSKEAPATSAPTRSALQPIVTQLKPEKDVASREP